MIERNPEAIDYVLREARENDVKFIRLWFTDILGNLKGFAITVEELEGAEELFFTGTTGEVRPCVRVDGTPVGDGGVGVITKRLSELFRARVEHVKEAAGAPIA